MKCIKSMDNVIIRVSELIANEKVTQGGWNYCSKSEWKQSKQSKQLTEKKTNKKTKEQ